jgi:hypothetical protein
LRVAHDERSARLQERVGDEVGSEEGDAEAEDERRVAEPKGPLLLSDDQEV